MSLLRGNGKKGFNRYQAFLLLGGMTLLYAFKLVEVIQLKL
jgi:hypothetical protein